MLKDQKDVRMAGGKAWAHKMREEMWAAGLHRSLWHFCFSSENVGGTKASKSTILFWAIWMKLLNGPPKYSYLPVPRRQTSFPCFSFFLSLPRACLQRLHGLPGHNSAPVTHSVKPWSPVPHWHTETHWLRSNRPIRAGDGNRVTIYYFPKISCSGICTWCVYQSPIPQRFFFSFSFLTFSDNICFYIRLPRAWLQMAPACLDP